MTVAWTDEMSVGVEVLDEDHRNLVDLINRYLAAITEDDLLLIHDVFRELERYTHYHFAREEALMAQCGFSGLDAHKRKHEVLTNRLRDLFEDVMWDSRIAADGEVRTFMESWLMEHILKEDFGYRKCLATLGLP